MRFRWHEPAEDCWLAGGDDAALLRTLLARRGLTLPDAVERFLHPHPARLADPYLMADMAPAVDRLARARQTGERVAIYGDYDVDGLTSTALLYRALTGIGLQVEPYVPHRVRDGYGLNRAVIDRLAASGVTLLIAVDCGISNRAEIAHARQAGVDTIVLDHHQVPAEMPQAVAVVNPHRPDCAYPSKELAAVGVAYTLVRALLQSGYSLGGSWQEDALDQLDLLDLVALGTVADVALLHGENRILVTYGLDSLRRTEHPGLRALCAVAGVEPARLKATDIGHILGPRLNAAGRIAEPEVALRLLLTASDAEAHDLARQLDGFNRQRRKELTRIVAEAVARVEDGGPPGEDRPLLQLDGEGWTAGLAGLVAGRLMERYSRPVLILERGGEESKGSARSIDGFNIIEALTTCDDLLGHYGGHARAAGLTVRNEHLPLLHERLLRLAAARLRAEQLQPALHLDVALPAHSLSWAMADTLARLEPCGHGNPNPLLLVRGVRPTWPKTSGDGKHLFFSFRAHGSTVRAVGFGQGERLAELREAGELDLAGTLDREWWQGEERLEFRLQDFRPAAARAASPPSQLAASAR